MDLESAINVYAYGLENVPLKIYLGEHVCCVKTINPLYTCITFTGLVITQYAIHVV